MSVKQGLLVLLTEHPKYGAQLRSEFEARTGGTWPLNVGQVYTTLTRLERDGLVEGAGGPDEEGRIAYQLTEAGQHAVMDWWAHPVDRADTPRDELVIKLALAVTAPGVDVSRIVQTQRNATMHHLQDLTRLKRQHLHDHPDSTSVQLKDLSWLLVLENHIFAAEAEIRWLDHVETAIRASGRKIPHIPATSLPVVSAVTHASLA